ncbi:MAG TPA: hypothetical protein VFR86_07010 [Burkholderiaceae bacterium]|nr:hypothetical protein [Burkholderiaceae bacterium]
MLRFAHRAPLLHDVCPIAWLLAPELFDAQRCTVAVDWRPGLTEGHLAAWRLPTGDDKSDNAVVQVFTGPERRRSARAAARAPGAPALTGERGAGEPCAPGWPELLSQLRSSRHSSVLTGDDYDA